MSTREKIENYPYDYVMKGYNTKTLIQIHSCILADEIDKIHIKLNSILFAISNFTEVEIEREKSKG